MPHVETRDGSALFTTDRGQGPAVLFVHSWGVHAQMWQYQMSFLLERGYRVVSYDRRGHGRSDEPGSGYDYDTLADDLAAVIAARDLNGVTLVGHSMGCGEIVRYLSRHGNGRVGRIVLVAPSMPCLTKSADNPDGVDESAFETMRAVWRKDFPGWLADNTQPFFTRETSPEMMRWAAGMLLATPLDVLIACNLTVTRSDLRGDTARVGVPTLVIHGDADQSAPLALTGRKVAALIAHCRFEIYAGAPHGLFLTHMDRLNADLLDFVADGNA